MFLGIDSETWLEVGKLAGAYVLALPVGWYREKEGHAVGVRTFPLVSMAACAYLLVACPPGQTLIDPRSRVIQGLVAGIGFIGGGAILKTDGNVHGTATAASIWNTGALGVAVAEERWALAITMSAINLFALRVLLPWKLKLDERREDRAKLEKPGV